MSGIKWASCIRMAQLLSERSAAGPGGGRRERPSSPGCSGLSSSTQGPWVALLSESVHLGNACLSPDKYFFWSHFSLKSFGQAGCWCFPLNEL